MNTLLYLLLPLEGLLKNHCEIIFQFYTVVYFTERKKRCNLKMLHVVISKFMLRGRSGINIEVFTVLNRAFEIE